MNGWDRDGHDRGAKTDRRPLDGSFGATLGIPLEDDELTGGGFLPVFGEDLDGELLFDLVRMGSAHSPVRLCRLSGLGNPKSRPFMMSEFGESGATVCAADGVE